MIQSFIHRILWSVFTSFLLIASPTFAMHSTSAENESPIEQEARCIWLDRGTIVAAANRAGIANLFDKLKRCGINVIYFETNNAGFAMFKSEIAQHNTIVNEQFDPLKVAVEEAHNRGMELHSWFWVFNVGNVKHNELVGADPNFPGPVIERHGEDWALRDAKGRMIPCDQHEFWLSPANTNARTYVLSLLREVTRKYEIDGIQLDYIRFPFQKPGTDMGFDEASKRRFESETGMSLAKLDRKTRKRWNEWKRQLVSDFVKDVSQSLRKIRPTLLISAAVFPFTREQRLVSIQQDWETWIEQGWVDVLNPMTYSSSLTDFNSAVGTVTLGCAGKGFVYPGIAISRCGSAGLLQQVKAARKLGCRGLTIFACAQLDDEAIKILSENPFKEPASPAHREGVIATFALPERKQT